MDIYITPDYMIHITQKVVLYKQILILVIIIKKDSIIQSQLKVVGACNLVGLGLDQSVDSLVESLHQDLEYLSYQWMIDLYHPCPSPNCSRYMVGFVKIDHMFR